MSANSILDQLEILRAHKVRLENQHMRAMFQSDPDRFGKFSLCLDTLVFDYSKNRIDPEAMGALINMATELGVEKMRTAMFSGEKINRSEDRAALHVALRGSVESSVAVDGLGVADAVAQVLDQMRRFSDAVRGGEYQLTGGKVTDVVNIGIGGSHAGPELTCRALSEYCDGPKVHFVSNVDSADLTGTLSSLNPETTLFIIASKTFTTAETMLNAHSARAWLANSINADRNGDHFVALSTNLEATRSFGIADERCFAFWDWVGGRYSIWSAIGLSLMIGIGARNFDAFLEGAATVDKHFCDAPLAENIPVIMAVLGIWYRNAWGCSAQAILPYDHRLNGLQVWLQQLDMESNGKSVDTLGNPVEIETAPIVFGEPGTNGQHAFYQLLHQGTEIVPCDFLFAAVSKVDLQQHRTALAANCFAQSEALMRGKTLEEAVLELVSSGVDEKSARVLAPHKVFEGNRPSNTFVYEELNPRTLGMLMALYEHKAFVQGVIWNINSFDQWGVELGKELSGQIQHMLESENVTTADNSSTEGLLRAYLKFRKS